jgi:hypothetical protein
MTRNTSRYIGNHLISFAALRLHFARPMRLALACLVLCAAFSARAQTSMTKVGTCDGMLKGTVGLAVPDGSGGFTQVGANLLDAVFSKAECDCDTQDVALQIQLTQALPMGTSGSLEMYVGSNCDNPDTRLNQSGTQTQCEQIKNIANGISFNNFVQGMSSGGTYIYVPVSARALLSPFTHECTANIGRSNMVFLSLVTNDQRNPAGTCKITPLSTTQLSGKPQNPNANSGDGAVTVRWDPVLLTETQPSYYQVLCATADGMPIPGITPGDPIYSQCVNGKIQRRTFLGGTSVTPGTGDMGTTAIVDMAAALPPPRLEIEATPTFDLAGVSGILPSLSPNFACSGQISPNRTTTFEQRISGLTNGVPYRFVVVATYWSNATSSDELIAVPQPAEDLWRRLRGEGADPSGFCDMGGAGHPMSWLPWALGALAIVVFRLVRRRST